jgi:tRNA A58 N-methylase Trm61
MRRTLCALLLLSLLVWAQGVHPITGRKYVGVMSADGADWLTRPERETEEQPDEALRLIGVAKGSTIADIGAGTGYITWRAAALAGPKGKVYAVDIQPRMLELLRQNMQQRGLTNVETVLGAVDDPKLPAASVDLVLMVDVYHEFSDRKRCCAISVRR